VSAFFVRPEEARDIKAIYTVIDAAFRDAPHSGGNEAAIVARLRNDGDLELSLVAESAGQVVGQIAFSPVTVAGEFIEWYGLGPVAVLPGHQDHGVGAALIERGLEIMQDRSAHGIVLLGDPRYYARFGFVHDPRLVLPDAPAKYFQCLVLAGEVPTGEVRYTEAFD